MNTFLSDTAIVAELQKLDFQYPNVTWAAIDEGIRFEGVGSDALKLVLSFARNKGTDFADLIGYQYTHAGRWLVISDEDGLKELEHHCIDPPRVGVVSDRAVRWITSGKMSGAEWR
jgi:hypothetical protein